MSNAMTGPLLTRAEQRAFVIALMDVPDANDWWWEVALGLSHSPWTLVLEASQWGGEARRELLLAAADLLRPRWPREEAVKAMADIVVVATVFGVDSPKYDSAVERGVRMITGEEL